MVPLGKQSRYCHGVCFWVQSGMKAKSNRQRARTTHTQPIHADHWNKSCTRFFLRTRAVIYTQVHIALIIPGRQQLQGQATHTANIPKECTLNTPKGVSSSNLPHPMPHHHGMLVGSMLQAVYIWSANKLGSPPSCITRPHRQPSD